MLAVERNSLEGRRRVRLAAYTAAFALAGFLDVTMSVRLFFDRSAGDSIAWGAVGAACYALGYVLIHMSAAVLRVETDAESVERDDDWLGRIAPHESERVDADEVLPWLSRVGASVSAAALVGSTVVVLFILAMAKTIVVVLTLAVLTDPSLGEVVIVIVVSGTLQVVAQQFVIAPITKRRGVEL